MKRVTVYRIMLTVRTEIPFMSLGGLFDMMRYDGSTVESSMAAGIVGFTLVLRRDNLPHTIERYHSFGIYPEELDSREILR